MVDTPGGAAQLGFPGRGPRLGRAIPLSEVSAIAKEVRSLIDAGQEHLALERVRSLHPADAGLILAGLPRASRETLLRVMSPDTLAWVLRQMNPVEAARLGTRLGVGALTFALRQVNPQRAIATLRRLPARHARAVAKTLDAPAAEAELLAQPADSAGALMVPEYPTVAIGERVGAARGSVRAMARDRGKFTHVFVVGPGGPLAGQIAMVDLALASDETPVAEVSTPIVAAVTVDTEADECARLRRHYNVTQLPVVEDGRLIGVILAESLLGALVEQDTRQMLQVASVAGESTDAALSESIRTRLPWLTLNLGTTFLAAATIALFESTLAQAVALAAVPAGGGGPGRHRRHADADADRAGDRAGGAGRGERAAIAGPRGRAGHPARGLAGAAGGGHRAGLRAQPGHRAGAGAGDAGQHDHRRLGGGRGAAVPAAGRGRSGGVVGGRRDHLHR